MEPIKIIWSQQPGGCGISIYVDMDVVFAMLHGPKRFNYSPSKIICWFIDQLSARCVRHCGLRALHFTMFNLSVHTKIPITDYGDFVICVLAVLLP